MMVIRIGYEESFSSAITRITSFREDLPKIKDGDLDFILKQFRDFCVNVIAHEDRYIDGVFDREFWPLIDGKCSASHAFYYKGSIYFKAHEAVKYYLSNPRKLKYCLRETHCIWEVLHGEINFDDLLCLIIIKHTEPDAFDFIITNIMALVKEKETGQIVTSFKSEISSGIFKNKTHLTELMQFLFPILLYTTEENTTPVIMHRPREQHLTPCLQIISEDEKYFRKIINSDIELSERKLLNELINSYREGKTTSLDIENIDEVALIAIQFKVAIMKLTDVMFLASVYNKIITKLCASMEKQEQSFNAIYKMLQPHTLNNVFNNNEQEEIIKHVLKFLLENQIQYVSTILDLTSAYPENKNSIVDFTYRTLIATPCHIRSKKIDDPLDICSIIIEILTSRHIHANGLFDWLISDKDQSLSIRYFYTLYSFSRKDPFPLFNVDSMKSFISECKIMADGFEIETQQQLLELERFIETPKPVDPEPVEG